MKILSSKFVMAGCVDLFHGILTARWVIFSFHRRKKKGRHFPFFYVNQKTRGSSSTKVSATN